MIRVLMSKGEGLDTEDFSLKSSELIRVALGNTTLNTHLMVGMSPAGKITLKAKNNLTDFNTPLLELFEGTLDELIKRLT